jgi:hypothetical protein
MRRAQVSKRLALDSLTEELRYVEHMLATNPERTTAHIMWQNRFDAIRTEIDNLHTEASPYASVTLIFNGDPVIGSREIRLDFASRALQDYQELVTTIFADKLYELGKKGPVRGKAQSRLYIKEIVHGSMGFILDEVPSNQSGAFPTTLKESVDRLSSLVEIIAGGGADVFESTIQELNPRILSALKRWTRTLRDFRAETKIVDDERQVVLSLDAITDLSERLNEVEITEEVQQEVGSLIGLLPEAGTYEFQLAEEDRVLSGPVGEALREKFASDPTSVKQVLLQGAVAQFKVIRKSKGGTVEREQRVLEVIQTGEVLLP